LLFGNAGIEDFRGEPSAALLFGNATGPEGAATFPRAAGGVELPVQLYMSKKAGGGRPCNFT
jgi:hypothetical protein